ncbi:uncharacterized protein si:dkey-39a18.1 [Tachysurus ichikawai]
MGITDKHAALEEAANWPAELHFHEINRRRMRRRNPSPSREVSPVPSYFSEPVSSRKRKDVTARLPCLINEAHQDEDDNDDIQSFKSLPTVMRTLTSDTKVNRSHTSRKEQGVSDLSLPLLVTSKCTLVVKGTGCTRTRGYLPTIKSTLVERPPCRAGCRPDNVEISSTRHPHPVSDPRYAPLSESCPKKSWNIKASCQHLHLSSSNEVSLGPRITFQSPVVQGINPISPDLMKESRHNVQACRPLRPVLKRAQVLNRGALHCLIEESYLPCSNNPRLLEPFSGFKEHLCHQLLNSPLPCRAALPHVNSHHLLQLEALLPVPQGLGSSLMQRTVELCNPQRRQLPCITMTRPTPSPKHLHNTENRHVA